MQTQAVVIPQAGTVELQQVTLRDPNPNEVVVQTVYTSISAGTERMLLAGQMPHPMLQLPVVPGYESVGRITDIGADVDDALKGEWVYVGGAMCYEGVNAAWGGQSSTLIASADKVVPLQNVEPQQGVLLALAATALHGVDVANIQAGQRVLIIGQGPVGQLAARIASQRGAWVAVSDLNSERLSRAQADIVVNAGEQDLTEAITDPVDTIIEASGSMDALADSMRLLGNGSTILLLGYYQQLTVPYMPLFLKEAKLLTAKEWANGDLQRCRDMIADGSLNVTSLLTHNMPIQQVADAYDTALNNQDCLKLVLNWGDA